MTRPFVLPVVFAIACAGGADVRDEGQVVPVADPSDDDGPVVQVEPWFVSITTDPDEGLSRVVVYRLADETTGVPDGRVLLYARCLGDHTEVEIEWGVPLGDDVYDELTSRPSA